MALNPSSLRRALATATILAAPLCAQSLPDPANLTGEHVSPPALADTLPINHGAPALQQLLLKLRTRASMILVVAHPDDEDGGFLTYESRGQGARVASFTLNRGEGGQNLMSADFNDALGLIRTQELLAADRYMGVDQFFGTEIDFGFSKTKEESFSKWTHERVLYDAVRVIRLYRPLILASVFVGGVTDGHGQHQVAGEITQEAFLAAADPKVFPEMGLPPWAPLKVYARTPFFRVSREGMYDYATGKYAPPVFHNYVTGVDIDHEPAPTVTIHESEVSTALGMNGDTYSQFARRGLALQRSQIGAGGRASAGGPGNDVGYTLMATRVGCPMIATASSSLSWAGAVCKNPPDHEQSPFDGIDITLPGIASLAPSAPATLRSTLGSIDKQVAEAQRLFDPAKIDLTAPPLREALRTLDTLIASTEKSSLDPTQKFNLLHELRIKRVQLNNALVLAHNLTFDGSFESSAVLQTTSHSASAHATLRNGGTQSLRILRLNPGFEQAEESAQVSGKAAELAAGASRMVESTAHFDAPRTPTRPYFSRPDPEQPFYNVAVPALRNAPATPPPFVSSATLDDQGVQLEIRAIVPDPSPRTKEFVAQAAVTVPPVSVAISPSAGILPIGETSLTVSTRTDSGIPHAPIPNATWEHVATTLRLPDGWKIGDIKRSDNAGIDLTEKFTVDPGKLIAGKPYRLTAIATEAHRDYTETFRPVGYPGLTYTNYYTPATYKATAVDVHTAPNLRIAYLPGTGDSVPEFLPNLGVTPTILTLKDLTPETLSKFDAIVLGVRAYAAHAELAGKGSQPLIDYAKSGGVVILQYNNARFGDDSAPYPITTPQSSGDHAHDVVEESQPVAVLAPDAPLLTWPNRITSADFNNWVEERGHGFAGTWSSEYTALLETHDPGQTPQKGGLLVAPVGKGAYIYCGLALYRQLPEGVPGAYRLFANLLSYAKNPHR